MNFKKNNYFKASILLFILVITVAHFRDTPHLLFLIILAVGLPLFCLVIIYRQHSIEKNQIKKQLAEQRDLILLAEQVADGQLDVTLNCDKKDDHVASAINKMVEQLKKKEIENQQLTQKLLTTPELLHIQKLDVIGQLAGGVAHEFNNVLAVILPTIEMLKENEKDSVRLNSYDLIMEAALQGSNIVKQLLQFSRKEQPQKKIISLVSVLESLEKMLLQVLGKAIHLDIDIYKTTKANTFDILGDETQLKQVFMNLALNSKDVMPKRGFYSIVVLALDSKINIIVSDTGPKIAKHILTTIFEPFYTTKHPGQGTGLGLSVVKGIIESHNGTIKALHHRHSTKKFIITLPRAVTHEPLIQKSEPKLNIIEENQARILVVDDNKNVLLTTQKILKKIGWQVDIAESVKVGLKLYQDSDYKYIILDYSMPEMNGIDGYYQFKQYKQVANIIMYTGDLYSEKLIKFTKKENIKLMYKPLSIEQINELLV